MGHRRDTIKKLTLFLVTLVIMLAACELLVRALGLAPEVFRVREGRFRLSNNPLIGYELVPDYAARDMGAMEDFPERSNSLGFRDREHTVAKPEGTYRILVLGDSITQGMFLREARHMYTRVLEETLRADGRNVEVLNFGVNGYNTRQEVETLREKGLRFEPDLVIVAWCNNDVFLDSGGILTNLKRREASRGAIGMNPALSWSHLYRLAYAVRLRKRGDARPLAAIPQDSDAGLVPAALGDLAELAATHGFRVLVVGFPFLDGLPADPRPEQFDAVRAACRRNGFRFLDLTDAFSAAARGGPIHVDPLHPNERGGRAAGEAIAAYVRRELLQ